MGNPPVNVAVDETPKVRTADSSAFAQGYVTIATIRPIDQYAATAPIA